jgi:hypothetical protein
LKYNELNQSFLVRISCYAIRNNKIEFICANATQIAAERRFGFTPCLKTTNTDTIESCIKKEERAPQRSMNFRGSTIFLEL